MIQYLDAVQINFVSVQLPINVTVCLFQNLTINYTVVREENTEAIFIAETLTHQGSDITLTLMSELISRDQSYLVVVMVSTVAGRSYANGHATFGKSDNNTMVFSCMQIKCYEIVQLYIKSTSWSGIPTLIDTFHKTVVPMQIDLCHTKKQRLSDYSRKFSSQLSVYGYKI